MEYLVQAAINRIVEINQQRIERNREEAAQKERLSDIDKLATEAGKYMSEAKTIGELEQRTTEAKNAFKALDSEYRRTKGNTGYERLLLNKHINISNQALEKMKDVKDKEQAINFTNRDSLRTELNRIRKSENEITIKATNAELKKSLQASTEKCVKRAKPLQ